MGGARDRKGGRHVVCDPCESRYTVSPHTCPRIRFELYSLRRASEKWDSSNWTRRTNLTERIN